MEGTAQGLKKLRGELSGMKSSFERYYEQKIVLLMCWVTNSELLVGQTDNEQDFA